MSLATLEQIQQLIDQSHGGHVRIIHEWEILYQFIDTDYESIFDVKRFSNLIEQQCETHKYMGNNVLKGKFLDVSYYLKYSTGDEKGFRFSMYNDKPVFLQSVTCFGQKIILETEIGEQKIFWRRNKSFDLNKYNIDVSLQEFPIENNEGYISCTLPIELDGSIQSREQAVKFASESLVYAFATRVFRIF